MEYRTPGIRVEVDKMWRCDAVLPPAVSVSKTEAGNNIQLNCNEHKDGKHITFFLSLSGVYEEDTKKKSAFQNILTQTDS